MRNVWIIIIVMVRLCKTHTMNFHPQRRGYNHLDAKLDWENGLREAALQTFSRENIRDNNLRGRIFTAPLIGKHPSRIPFGDIALLARGQIYGNYAGYVFVQEELFCDGNKAYQTNQNEVLLALWSVKRIRHRSSRSKHNVVNLEFIISPVNGQYSKDYLRRGGSFNYDLPGHIFTSSIFQEPSNLDVTATSYKKNRFIGNTNNHISQKKSTTESIRVLPSKKQLEEPLKSTTEKSVNLENFTVNQMVLSATANSQLEEFTENSVIMTKLTTNSHRSEKQKLTTTTERSILTIPTKFNNQNLILNFIPSLENQIKDRQRNIAKQTIVANFYTISPINIYLPAPMVVTNLQQTRNYTSSIMEHFTTTITGKNFIIQPTPSSTINDKWLVKDTTKEVPRTTKNTGQRQPTTRELISTSPHPVISYAAKKNTATTPRAFDTSAMGELVQPPTLGVTSTIMGSFSSQEKSTITRELDESTTATIPYIHVIETTTKAASTHAKTEEAVKTTLEMVTKSTLFEKTETAKKTTEVSTAASNVFTVASTVTSNVLSTTLDIFTTSSIGFTTIPNVLTTISNVSTSDSDVIVNSPKVFTVAPTYSDLPTTFIKEVTTASQKISAITQGAPSSTNRPKPASTAGSIDKTTEKNDFLVEPGLKLDNKPSIADKPHKDYSEEEIFGPKPSLPPTLNRKTPARPLEESGAVKELFDVSRMRKSLENVRGLERENTSTPEVTRPSVKIEKKITTTEKMRRRPSFSVSKRPIKELKKIAEAAVTSQSYLTSISYEVHKTNHKTGGKSPSGRNGTVSRVEKKVMRSILNVFNM
ncbi:mucin-3A-like [Euwallacea fornicatus]|uniref:mucin-3A-like n=1 Tax=Euwallacea fornicatus TaxID=995702 RepID=UPI00338E6DAC